MKVKVEVGTLKAMHMKLLEELKTVPAIMRAAADLGAFEEKMDHTYQNRTGRLEASTKARTIRATGREIRVELGMYMGYAGYVRDRGLSTIDSAAARVGATIEDAFSRFGRV